MYNLILLVIDNFYNKLNKYIVMFEIISTQDILQPLFIQALVNILQF